MITKCFNNGTLNLKCGAIKINYNIRRIMPYKLDTKFEDSISINMYDPVNIKNYQSYTSVLNSGLETNYTVRCTRRHLKLINTVRVLEVFMKKYFI